MKFGFPVWYGDGSIRKSVETAHKLDFDYVELSLDYPWPERFSKKDITLLKNLKKEYSLDMAFHAPWGGIDLCYPRKDILEASMKVFSDSIKFAKTFSPLYFNFHLITNLPTWKCANIKKEIYKKTQETVKQLLFLSKKFDMQFTIENNSRKLFSETNEFKHLLGLENIKFCFDVGHAAKSAGGDMNKKVSKWIKTFRKKLLVLHLHDTLGGNDHLDHLPIGDGDLEIRSILETIRTTSCKYILIELQRKTNGESVSNKDFEKSLEFCRNNL